MQSPIKYFAAINEFRQLGKVRHKLENIIAITITAVICNKNVGKIPCSSLCFKGAKGKISEVISFPFIEIVRLSSFYYSIINNEQFHNTHL